MTFRLVQELAADGVIVAVTCRVLCVSSSGYYELLFLLLSLLGLLLQLPVRVIRIRLSTSRNCVTQ